MDTFVDFAAAVREADGVAAFNEATMLAFGAAEPPRIRVKRGPSFAVAVADAPVELAVDPAHRLAGHGTALLREMIAAGETEFWAHGDLPGARALAAQEGLSAVRTLLILRHPDVTATRATALPDGLSIRSATPDDVDRILAINAAAFVEHPEQGAMDREDFDRRAAADWFSWDGLLVGERGGQIIGFHWTKIEPSDGQTVGEVYVVGVDPVEHGGGVGTALTAAGLVHLANQGVTVVDLYVEADNEAALRTYRGLGFGEHARDTLYRLDTD